MRFLYVVIFIDSLIVGISNGFVYHDLGLKLITLWSSLIPIIILVVLISIVVAIKMYKMFDNPKSEKIQILYVNVIVLFMALVFLPLFTFLGYVFFGDGLRERVVFVEEDKAVILLIGPGIVNGFYYKGEVLTLDFVKVYHFGREDDSVYRTYCDKAMQPQTKPSD